MRAPIKLAIQRSIWKQRPAPQPESRLIPGVRMLLASEHCTLCGGEGLIFMPGHHTGPRTEPCGCVLRKIFRACLEKYCLIQSNAQVSHSKMERIDTLHAGQRRSRFVFGRKQEEFAADFYLIAKRTLNPQLWRIFKLHFLLGLDWKACAYRLFLTKGAFFHDVYRIQEQCGRAFFETRPYAIFPTDEYFGERSAAA